MENYSSFVMDCLMSMHDRAQVLESEEIDSSTHEGEWRGLGYILNEQRVITAMHELTAIVDCPDLITKVPSTPEWMVGLTNYLGEVLPISDLQSFIGGAPVKMDSRSKVLVARSLGKFTGILVPDVLGIQYLPENKKQHSSIVESRLDEFVYEVFGIEDRAWPVISMAALLADARFLMARAFSDTGDNASSETTRVMH